jgi:hypothetical protein
MVLNNNRCVHLAAVTKSCWHSPNTHMNVYTLKAKTRTHTETEWIMSTHQSRDFSYCHTSLTSLYSLIWLGDLCLFRNREQVRWMKGLYDFALHVPIEPSKETETNSPWSQKSVFYGIRKLNPRSISGWSNMFVPSGQEYISPWTQESRNPSWHYFLKLIASFRYL